MKVTARTAASGTAAALLLLLACVVCTTASPMFGTGGMMKRRFPGAPDMSYRAYREIEDDRRRAAQDSVEEARDTVPAVATRFGGQEPVDSDEWMFGNSVGGATTIHRHPGGSEPHYHPSSSDDRYNQRFPTSFSPRESYAYLNNFPDYHSHTTSVQNRKGAPAYHQILIPGYY